MQREVIGMMLIAMAMTASAANAQSPRGAVSQISASGVYLWVDGAYHSVNLFHRSEISATARLARRRPTSGTARNTTR
ncbi:MAG: hypothetical protein K8F62_01560, partial [Pseudorhodoplanes sp.]|nr:hypothetical protein [Pseudorhodoplanes sp.]